ncbi:hypothetical protein LI328DRAFT_161166 [Trichoderma asperelloides]|nr:hypothetical protein LI328DRAFT_161166 [Trichoderma asperelloides]
MSSTIFLKAFVGKLVEPINRDYSAFADTLAKRQTWDAEARINRVKKDVQFLGNWVQGQWRTVGNQWVLESTSTSTHTETPWEGAGESFTIQVVVQAIMTSALEPLPGTGKFHIKQTLQIPVLTSTITERGVLIQSISSNQTEEEKRKWVEYQAVLIGTIENRVHNTADFTSKINQGSNGQSKFIFPGGGNLDMSDPVFSNTGDLLLGLVYRQGKI